VILVELGLIGITLIISRGTIFYWFQQRWPTFIKCAQCTGMWVGMAAGAAGLMQTGHGLMFDVAAVGGATSFLSLLANAILIRLLEK
jgi:hypothetical protein